MSAILNAIIRNKILFLEFIRYKPVKCDSSEYECRLSKQCVPQESRCDGKIDCSSGKEDELDCSKW